MPFVTKNVYVQTTNLPEPKKIPEQRSACSVHFPCLDLLWEVSEELVFVAVVELVEEVVILGVGEVMGVPRATHTYLVQQCLAHA